MAMSGAEILFGAAAVEGGAAATAGLFGAGGAFSLGQTALTLGALGSAYGAVSAGSGQADAMRYNARVSENEAVAARQASEFEIDQNRRRRALALGEMSAATAGSGLTAEGSPLLAQSQLAAESELDELAIRYSGSIAEAQARSKAAAERLQAASYRRGGIYAGGASLLKGFSRFNLSGASAATPAPAG
jgi:hypothetical protein